MKLTIILVLAACLQVSAKGYSQRVTLHQTNVSLQKIFEAIRQQTGYHFFYADEVLAKAQNVSVHIKKGSIEEVLAFCFENQRLSYTISENTIIVKEKAPLPKLDLSPPTEKSGTVKNDKGEPLAGATVSVKGKNRAVTTNNEGKFTINAEVGDVLVISFVGYSTYEIKVSAENNFAIKLSKKEAQMETITVVGSRGRPRTDVERPVPVDIFTAKEIQKTGQTDLGQMLHFSAPSFNSTKYGISNVTSYVDPATLRGLGTRPNIGFNKPQTPPSVCCVECK